ncbi:hypothetical protein CLV47_12916 [Antricoccus suffuscus]|uniref:Uncharacterized protein n=1 Tax=Antricoccus suffuscus TaxID=1629062 RepID=A0A2T0Z3P8_9ACTN|nr:hypothetical protein [Antricoccus suffuscus]PRZ30774.1 hypothetical protein CLV47_12916 [Antricoccus suffuscus]
MPAANRPSQPPEEPSGRPRMSKPQKRLLVVVGAVLLLAIIGWLIDTLAPMPPSKKSGADTPQTSVVSAHAPPRHGINW